MHTSHDNGCSGSTCHCKKNKCKCPPSLFLLKFTGRSGTGEFGSTAYLADPGVGPSVAALGVAPNYPVGETFSATTLSVNLLTPTPPGVTLVVEVLKNGAPLPVPLFVAYGGANPLSGFRRAVLGAPLAYAIGDTFDIRAVVVGLLTTPLSISATLTARS